MGLFDRLFGREQKSASVTTSLDLFREIYGGRESAAGKVVTWQTALEVTTVLSCVRCIAEGISQVPFRVYQDDGKTRRLAKDLTLFNVLYRRPNSWQTSFEFRETLMLHTVLTGNAFVFVNRIGRERDIRELVLIEPRRVEVEQKKDMSLVYKVSSDTGEKQEFGQDAIWHMRGPSWNSWMGLEATRLARDAIGLTMSLEDGQAESQKNGTRVSGLYTMKEKISPDKFSSLAKWIDQHSIGGERSGKTMVLDGGADFKSTQMTGVESQTIETRKHQIEEICRAFRVMPIMVGHADKTATYASAEQMFLAHVIHTLAPWYERIEQSADVNLLSEEQRAEGYYTKFTPNALMRGAAADRAEFYAKGLGSGGSKGWLTQNDVRAFEDMDAIEDPEADKLPQQNNSSKPAGTTEPPPAEQPK